MTFGYWNDWFQSALYISDSKLVSLQALLNNMMKNLEYIANNPSAGLSLQQYRNSMPSESVRMAIRNHYRHSHCVRVSVLPEVLYFRSDGWCG